MYSRYSNDAPDYDNRRCNVDQIANLSIVVFVGFAAAVRVSDDVSQSGESHGEAKDLLYNAPFQPILVHRRVDGGRLLWQLPL